MQRSGFTVCTGLGSSPFARRYWGIDVSFLFLVLQMVHFPVFLSPMYSAGDTDVFVRFPHSDIPVKTVCVHRGLSQFTTSFIAFSCQGIHHVHPFG